MTALNGGLKRIKPASRSGKGVTATTVLVLLTAYGGSRKTRLLRWLRRWVAHGIIGDTIRRLVRRHPYFYGDKSRVSIGESVTLNDTFLNTISGRIRVGDYAFFGFGVSLLAGTHDFDGVFDRARQLATPSAGYDIVIGRGAWIASNATVLGPCVIGDHAVVAAGALVTGDVPAYAVVAGVPAKVVRMQKA